MRITFNPYRQVQFRGIRDAVSKIQSKIQSGTFSPMDDSFTPSSEKTVIIENYYENESKDTSPLKKVKKVNAATEGVIAGTTSGTAIVGAKGISEKIKGAKDAVTSNDNIDLLESENASEVGIESETPELAPDDVEIYPETEVVVKPEIDVDDIDIEPEIDDLGLEPELDIDDISEVI